MNRPTHRIHNAKLNCERLEDRSNPAKFAISMLSPLEGEIGETAATHTGSLSLPYSVVTATDATEAVKSAFSGSISVSGVGTYTFSPSNVGEEKPFQIESSGEQFAIATEDIAGQPGCDWDYNDHYWIMMVREVGLEAVVYSGSATTWVSGPPGGPSNGTATVALTVTENKPGYEGLYYWNYTVTNVDYLLLNPLSQMSLNVAEVGGLDHMASSLGWAGSVTVNPSAPHLVRWQASGGQSPLSTGQSATFSFTTPVTGIGDASGQMGFYHSPPPPGFPGGVADPVPPDGAVKAPELMIRSVTWGAVNTAGTLSENKAPDGPMMPGGGKKIFADRLRPTDAAEDSGNQVYARVELSQPVTEEKLVEGYLFDVDDPSSSDAKLDDEKAKPGADPAADNRGLNPDLGIQIVTVPKDRNFGRLKVHVSTQPGDNFRFAANINLDETLGGTVKAKVQGQGNNATYGDEDKAGIYFQEGRGGAVPSQDAKTVKSELLTVWRRLHVELDHMEKPLVNEQFGPDDEAPTADLPDPDITLLRANLMPAYVQVFDDIAAANTHKSMPFVHNLEVNNYQTTLMSIRDVESKEDFWVWHAVGAYEAGLLKDFDWVGANLPANESATKGQTTSNKRGTPYVEGGSMVYNETIRDFQSTGGPFVNFPVTATFEVARRRTVLHRASALCKRL